tara:strand:- start:4806 stop:5621 length:816 start_codon:yes stop_codon:yes gene_type:complete
VDDATRRLQEISSYWLDARDSFRGVITASLPSGGSGFDADLSLVRRTVGTLPQSAFMLNSAFDSAEVLELAWHVPSHHVPSDYILMRAMLDNALRTIWLLEPNETQERLERAWLLARDAPSRSKIRATTMIKTSPQRPSAEKLKAAASNAKAYIADLDDTFEKAIGPLPPATTLRANDFIAAAERQEFEEGEDGGITRLWSQLSELVHGSMVPTEYRRIADTPVGHLRPTRANVVDIALSAGLITKALDGALGLFYSRFEADDVRRRNDDQ